MYKTNLSLRVVGGRNTENDIQTDTQTRTQPTAEVRLMKNIGQLIITIVNNNDTIITLNWRKYQTNTSHTNTPDNLYC